jgi:hypothetical protein
MKTPRLLFGAVFLLSFLNLLLTLWGRAVSRAPESPNELLDSMPAAITSATLIIALFGYVASLLGERRMLRR